MDAEQELRGLRADVLILQAAIMHLVQATPNPRLASELEATVHSHLEEFGPRYDPEFVVEVRARLATLKTALSGS